MTFSRTATLPVGLTAYPAQTVPGAKPVLRVTLAQGSIADLSAEDALALSDYIQEKFAGAVAHNS